MDSTDVLWLVVLILIVFSAIFSSSETAFSSFNRIRIKSYAAEGNKQAKRVLRLSKDFNRILTAILIGNNIVNIATASIGTVLFTKYFGAAGPGISTIVITILVLIGGEILPKSFAKDHAESTALKSSGFILFITVIFRPFIFLFGKLKDLMAKFTKSNQAPSVTEQELKVIIEEIEDEGVLEDHESKLVRSALDFDETTAEQVLTPRVDLVSAELNTDNETLCSLFLEKGFSRIPIYKKDIDNIIGILYERDFFREYIKSHDFSILPILQKPLFVPPQTKISDLFKQIQQRQEHMAVVTDQYGGVEGIITVEDMLEELVGDIYDKNETVVQDVQKLSDTAYLINPDMGIDDLFEEIDYHPFQFETESNTVGGWVLEQFQKLPQQGESFTQAGLKVTVQQLNQQRITSLLIEKLQVVKEEDY
ncbi:MULTISPECIES: hemolysin family protein [Clostridiaceae]|uniref:HlyC/CorC family transporter n=1 Tax=Clostridium facile TaxID=2763035 RepID=A0ABR7IRM1_9CLOT|nr:hemolysin family protein [Massilioclostridium coli]MBC5787781.1 HlyC/CorC family transporter [Clostridium facile]